jgi:hypothetical protein
MTKLRDEEAAPKGLARADPPCDRHGSFGFSSGRHCSILAGLGIPGGLFRDVTLGHHLPDEEEPSAA